MPRRCASWLALGLSLLLAACNGGLDPFPGTVKLNIRLHGEPRSCMLLVYNEAGAQTRLIGVNGDGKALVEELPPGTYTFRFRGHDEQLYPAVRSVKLYAAGEVELDVELSQAAAPPEPAAQAP